MGNFARISHISKLFSFVFKEVAHGIRGIVVYAEGGNADISYLYRAARFNVGVTSIVGNATQLLPHVAGAVNMELVFFGKLAQSADVVRVLVGKEQGAELRHTESAFFKPIANARGADTGVDQQAGIATAYNGGVTFATAGQY